MPVSRRDALKTLAAIPIASGFRLQAEDTLSAIAEIILPSTADQKAAVPQGVRLHRPDGPQRRSHRLGRLQHVEHERRWYCSPIQGLDGVEVGHVTIRKRGIQAAGLPEDQDVKVGTCREQAADRADQQ